MARRPETIRTARLSLRPLTGGDACAMARTLGDYDILRWMADLPYPLDVDQARDFISVIGSLGDGAWAVEDGDGFCGVMMTRPALHFMFARRVWGRGYATEAGDAVLDRHFAARRAPDLTAESFAANARSAGVLEKLGFRRAGQGHRSSVMLRQDLPSLSWHLTRETWRQSRRYRLRTRRLRLRELRDADLPTIRRIGGDARVAPMILAATVPWSEDAARRWLHASKYRGRPGFRAAICSRWGRLIGTVFIGSTPDGGPTTCAWFVDPAHWGRGVATEAAGAFLADTMDRFAIPQVEADHFTDNPAGGAVLRKLGFVEAGRGTGTSAARLEPAPVVIYRLDRSDLKVPR